MCLEANFTGYSEASFTGFFFNKKKKNKKKQKRAKVQQRVWFQKENLSFDIILSIQNPQDIISLLHYAFPSFNICNVIFFVVFFFSLELV